MLQLAPANFELESTLRIYQWLLLITNELFSDISKFESRKLKNFDFSDAFEFSNISNQVFCLVYAWKIVRRRQLVAR